MFKDVENVNGNLGIKGHFHYRNVFFLVLGGYNSNCLLIPRVPIYIFDILSLHVSMTNECMDFIYSFFMED